MKPLDSTKISEDSFFVLKEALKLYKAKVMPGFDDFDQVRLEKTAGPKTDPENCEKVFDKLV